MKSKFQLSMNVLHALRNLIILFIGDFNDRFWPIADIQLLSPGLLPLLPYLHYYHYIVFAPRLGLPDLFVNRQRRLTVPGCRPTF